MSKHACMLCICLGPVVFQYENMYSNSQARVLMVHAI